MELTLNNKKKLFAEPTLTVQALLDIEAPDKQKGIAVAVNNSVIPKADWNNYTLSPNDYILIISATQGG